MVSPSTLDGGPSAARTAKTVLSAHTIELHRKRSSAVGTELARHDGSPMLVTRTTVRSALALRYASTIPAGPRDRNFARAPRCRELPCTRRTNAGAAPRRAE